MESVVTLIVRLLAAFAGGGIVSAIFSGTCAVLLALTGIFEATAVFHTLYIPAWVLFGFLLTVVNW